MNAQHLGRVLALVIPFVGLSANAERPPKLAIVVVKGKGGPNIAPQGKALERSLDSHADILPFKKYQAAAKKAKVNAKALGTMPNVLKVGSNLGLTHVLVVESGTEKVGSGKRKTTLSTAKASLIEIATGDVLFGQTFSFKGKKLTKDVSASIVEQVKGYLVPPSRAPEPVAEAAPPPASPDAPAPPDQPTLASSDREMPPPDAPPPADAPTESESAAPAQESAASDGGPAEGSGMPGESVAYREPGDSSSVTMTDRDMPSRKNGAWRPGFILRLGALSFMRRGTVDDSSALDPITYEGRPMPAGLLQLEFYPLALGGKGDWTEGLGIEAEGIFTQALTLVREEPREVAKSQVWLGQGGLSLRFVLGDTVTSPEIRVRAGYGMYAFPLPPDTFPGVQFAGPYGGLSALVPVAESFGIAVGGIYTPALAVTGSAESLGTLDKGAAFDVEAGFRLSFAPWQFSLMGRMRQYDATFSGPSTLPGATDYVNATLQDRYLSGYLTAGVGF